MTHNITKTINLGSLTGGEYASEHELKKETENRKEADDVLNNLINDEILSRNKADDTLQINIDKEKGVREEADNTLNSKVDNEVNRATTRENNLETAINNEVINSQNANISLTNGLNTEKEARETVDQSIQLELSKVKSIAGGAAVARVFETKEELDVWLLDSKNTSKLKVGDHLLIEELEVPDYWWNGTGISQLETQKVDLSDYYNKEDVDLLDSGKVNKSGNNATFENLNQIAIGNIVNNMSASMNNRVLMNAESEAYNHIVENISGEARDNILDNVSEDSRNYFVENLSLEAKNKLAEYVNYVNEPHDLYVEIEAYGLKYRKIKELINKSDAGNFTISCEYTKLGLTSLLMGRDNQFNIDMKARYDTYYQLIEEASDDDLKELSITFSDLVNAEIKRINNL